MSASAPSSSRSFSPTRAPRSGWLAQHLAALRALLVLTVVTGLLYPLAVTAIAQLPGLRSPADGSVVHVAGRAVGSSLIGQSFTDKDGNPLPQYVQSRPSAAGSAGYDPTATSASNLGPESVVDTLPDPAAAAGSNAAGGAQSLLTQVCARSQAIGVLDGVDGSRPFCTTTTDPAGVTSGIGAVLGVFRSQGLTGPAVRVVSLNQACPAPPFVATYEGVAVECARFGADYSRAVVTPVRGSAPSAPAVPSDAVTASGSGLDPGISVAYARLQAPRVAAARGTTTSAVLALVGQYTTRRTLGFLGEPTVNVLGLNLALDRRYPATAR